MGKRLTDKEFIERVIQEVNAEYTPLTLFKGVHHKVLMKHNKCGHVWYVEAKAFLGTSNKTGSRCPKCYGNAKKTTESFSKELLEDGNGEYELLSNYVNAHTLVKIKHNVCGNIYMQSPMSFSAGYRCKYCQGNFVDNAKIDDKLRDYTFSNYERVSDYTSAKIPFKIRHIACAHEFSVTGITIDRNKFVMCPACFNSMGEAKVDAILSSLGVDFIRQYVAKGLNQRPFDFYLPQYSLLIEYQGKQHFEPSELFGGEDMLKRQKERDQIKRNFVDNSNNSYKLLELTYKNSSVNEMLELITSKLEK